MEQLEYRGLKGSVDIDEPTQEFVGRVLDLPDALVLYEGATMEELEQDFKNAVDDYLRNADSMIAAHEHQSTNPFAALRRMAAVFA
ncbi:hypothetical protein AGMMS49982_03420 [Bacteroidia bacterium]|nr:hypothetical protein AGMMS49982_03420 [Bacteroidia bacterium]